LADQPYDGDRSCSRVRSALTRLAFAQLGKTVALGRPGVELSPMLRSTKVLLPIRDGGMKARIRTRLTPVYTPCAASAGSLPSAAAFGSRCHPSGLEVSSHRDREAWASRPGAVLDDQADIGDGLCRRVDLVSGVARDPHRLAFGPEALTSTGGIGGGRNVGAAGHDLRGEPQQRGIPRIAREEGHGDTRTSARGEEHGADGGLPGVDLAFARFAAGRCGWPVPTADRRGEMLAGVLPVAPGTPVKNLNMLPATLTTEVEAR
jgi:hypothetical protein